MPTYSLILILMLNMIFRVKFVYFYDTRLVCTHTKALVKMTVLLELRLVILIPTPEGEQEGKQASEHESTHSL